MNQGQIVCSFCSAEFTVPPGLNEAVCPKCGKATPLFTSQFGGNGEEDESPQQAAIVPPPPPQQMAAIAPPPPGGELLGRINLKQVPASQAGPGGRSASQPGVPREPDLDSLSPTDAQGQLRPDVIQRDQGLTTDTGLGAPTPGAASKPDLLADLDAQLDAEGFDDDIPEAEPLMMDPNMEIPEEFSDFFNAEETPGLNLPNDGAIAVNIPTAPIQERMSNEALSSSDIEAPLAEAAPAAADAAAASSNDRPTAEPSPALRLGLFIGAGVLVLGAALLWLLL